MRNVVAASLAMAVLVLPTPARAEAVTLQPTPADPRALEHSQHYTRGETPSTFNAQQQLASATLAPDNIRGERDGPSQLHLHLPGSAPKGVAQYPDDRPDEDSFAGEGLALVTWQDLPEAGGNLDYTFSPSQRATLQDYLVEDGEFGLGFDPRGRFADDGAKLPLHLAEAPIARAGGVTVPEPAMAGLLLVGGVAMALRRVRRRRTG